ncbi:hypothetical protein VTP01DRAFT_10793 [Rhizomucor pusillus]|uniref:uncharacterized protein n=1 Tax=Rhizomucor pusillus TaxID=4840 RepID=UPI0037437344
MYSIVSKLATLAILAASMSMAMPLEPRATAKVYSKCSKPGTYALTFDDGPYEYTWKLADDLKAAGVKATFFINGNNWVNVATDSVDTSSGKKTYKQVLKHVYDQGHQIGSHTYGHKELSSLSASEVKSQMNKLSDIIYSTIGKRPAFMRPPAGDYDEKTLEVLGQLGYKVIMWDIDTLDWKTHNLNSEMQIVKDALNNAPASNSGHIALEHETYDQTVKQFVPKVVELVKSKGYKMVTVAECLGYSNAYQ